MQCLLADLYFSITLELTRRKALDLFYLIGLFKKISQACSVYSDEYDSIMVIVLHAEKVSLTVELCFVGSRETGSDTRTAGDTGWRASLGQ